jgi:putative SOS response-associated peptidase YedK
LIKSSSKKLLYFAGLYDEWHSKDNNGEYSETEPLSTYSIVTIDSISELAQIHERMPLILEGEEQIENWLNCEVPYSVASKSIRPIKDPHSLISYQVPPLVNSIKSDNSDCIRPLAEWKKQQISKFWGPKSPEKREHEETSLPRHNGKEEVEDVENVNKKIKFES